MASRFFSPAARGPGPLELEGEEAHHAVRVMRLAAGDSLTVFDGRGNAYPATIERAGKRALSLMLGPPLRDPGQPPWPIRLAVAPPKGDRQRWLLEKATELGVTDILPLSTERSVVQPKGVSDKWLRAAVEACKQCGRNQLPEFHPPQTWESLRESRPESAGHRLLAHPQGGAPLSRWLLRHPPPWPAGTTIAIGPEGGWSPEEVAAAEARGWTRISLGPRILRIDTAAVAAAALLCQAADSAELD